MSARMSQTMRRHAHAQHVATEYNILQHTGAKRRVRHAHAVHAGRFQLVDFGVNPADVPTG